MSLYSVFSHKVVDLPNVNVLNLIFELALMDFIARSTIETLLCQTISFLAVHMFYTRLEKIAATSLNFALGNLHFRIRSFKILMLQFTPIQLL